MAHPKRVGEPWAHKDCSHAKNDLTAPKNLKITKIGGKNLLLGPWERGILAIYRYHWNLMLRRWPLNLGQALASWAHWTIQTLNYWVRAQLDSGWTWVHRQPYVLNMLGHDGLLIIPWIRPITFNYGANKKARPMPWAKNKSLNPDVGLASQH